eukprot:gene9299-6538_t
MGGERLAIPFTRPTLSSSTARVRLFICIFFSSAFDSFLSFLSNGTICQADPFFSLGEDEPAEGAKGS